jgi:hypothetical protein
VVHEPRKNKQGPASAGGKGAMKCGDEWGRSSHTSTYNGISKSAVCFRSQLSPNEQVLVPCSSCTRAPPIWKVSEQGSLHVVGACGVLQHDASGMSGTERMGDVDALARGTRTNVNSSRHADGSTVEGGESCRTRARRNGMKIIMPPSKAMERQIVSAIASGELDSSEGSISE